MPQSSSPAASTAATDRDRDRDRDRGPIFEEVVTLFQSRTDWHGFRSRTELAERYDHGEVAWIHRGGRIVCAATYRHRQRSHTRVYFTAMADDAWDQASWTQMVRSILLESPHDRVIAKTPIESAEHDLWSEIAIRLREEDELVVWELLDEFATRRLEEW